MKGDRSVAAEKTPYRLVRIGRRGQRIFFEDADFQAYMELLAGFCRQVGTRVLGYCLLPERVHLIMVPSRPGGVRGVVSRTHRLYRRGLAFRRGPVTDFSRELLLTFPLESGQLADAVRFVEKEPVRAGLTATPWDYPWSSARAHVVGEDDLLVTVEPLVQRVPDWKDFLVQEEDRRIVRRFKRQERRGRLAEILGLTSFMGGSARPGRKQTTRGGSAKTKRGQ